MFVLVNVSLIGGPVHALGFFGKRMIHPVFAAKPLTDLERPSCGAAERGLILGLILEPLASTTAELDTAI